jgi:SWI/SNF-related matrix-associated actin-dependent regulator 1 of chromatin subfamily A
VTLFDYQNEGATWLAGQRRAILGDGMRVGKTPQAIVAADMIGARSVLVVCPGIAREGWGRAWQQWSFFGRPVAVVMDKDDPIEPNGVTILSLDGSRNDALHARIMAHKWDVLILDEAQYLKEPKSQRTKQVCSAKGFAARAGRIWFLTGTPMLNHPAELWVMLRTIGVTTEAYSDFMDRFCEWFEGDYGPVVKGMKNLPELKHMLAPVMLRRTYHQMFPDVPTPIWHDVELDLAHCWEEELANLRRVEGMERYGRRLEIWLRRQAAGEDVPIYDCIPKSCFAEMRHLTALAKMKPTAIWLKGMLDRDEIDKVVVFAHHGRMLDVLQDELRDYGAKTVYGATRPEQRQRRIDFFNQRYHRRVLLMQDSIGRTAIDLTGACHLVFSELDTVPDNNAQAAMRVQGPKQTRPVHLWVPRLPGTTDDLVTQILLRKSKMVVDLLG